MGEKPCVMPPLPVVGKWPLRRGWALRSQRGTASPAAAYHVVPYVREGSSGSGPWGGTAARPVSDRGTPQYRNHR